TPTRTTTRSAFSFITSRCNRAWSMKRWLSSDISPTCRVLLVTSISSKPQPGPPRKIGNALGKPGRNSTLRLQYELTNAEPTSRSGAFQIAGPSRCRRKIHRERSAVCKPPLLDMPSGNFSSNCPHRLVLRRHATPLRRRRQRSLATAGHRLATFRRARQRGGARDHQPRRGSLYVSDFFINPSRP